MAQCHTHLLASQRIVDPAADSAVIRRVDDERRIPARDTAHPFHLDQVSLWCVHPEPVLANDRVSSKSRTVSSFAPHLPRLERCHDLSDIDIRPPDQPTVDRASRIARCLVIWRVNRLEAEVDV